MNNNANSLIKNTAIFTISNFSSKLLVFLMLPLYTSILTTDEYGRADLVIAISTFILPLLTLSIADATLRYSLDKKYDKRKVFVLSFEVCTAGIILLLLLLPLLKSFLFFEVKIIYLILISCFSFYSGMLSMMARGLNKIFLVGIAGVVSTLATVLSNILFLVVFKWGIDGYLTSVIITHLSSCLVLFFGCNMYKLFSLKDLLHPDLRLLGEMIKYAMPLIPRNISWWIIDTANKYILGLKASTVSVGIYSAAIKIPTILTTVQGFFSQAWVLSAIDANECDKKEQYYSSYYAYYTTVLFIISSGLILISQFLSHFLYAKEFSAAGNYVPILILSSLFGGLIGFTSSIFSAMKKTNAIFIATSVGAVVSVSLDFLLIPCLDILGAALSNLIAYFLIWIIGIIILRKYINFHVKWFSFCIRICLIVIQSLLFLIMEKSSAFYMIQVSFLILSIMFGREELLIMLKILFLKIKRKN